MYILRFFKGNSQQKSSTMPRLRPHYSWACLYKTHIVSFETHVQTVGFW